MLTTEFTSYFNSYAKRNPLSLPMFSQESGALTVRGRKRLAQEPLIDMRGAAAKRLSDALLSECAEHDISIPIMLAVPSDQPDSFATALQDLYSLAFNPTLSRIFSDVELRAMVAHEVKHLYQDTAKTVEERYATEFDADRAMVRAVGYEAAAGFLIKLFAFKDLQQKMPLKKAELLDFLKHGKHEKTYTPDLVSAYVYDSSDFHPSTGDRLQALEEYARTLDL